HYAAADVSVSPSLSDNHGAALEASSMGVACIVSDAGGLPETVDEQSGWVVPRADLPALIQALESAYQDFDSCDLPARGARARERMIRLFDQSIAAARVVDVIERTAGVTEGGPR
ncbi:MAG: glycosyltransferase, partial [Longispora sp.]|nr:glycosyltransferase [Longispora sp. (in: high G+C Gram-positive bacteria)]